MCQKLGLSDVYPNLLKRAQRGESIDIQTIVAAFRANGHNASPKQVATVVNRLQRAL